MKSKNDVLNRTMYVPTTLQVREAEGEQESRIIEGYSILFDTPSDLLWCDEDGEAREVIAPEAITREILDKCDIKFTMFHDRQLLLARSKNGVGTLSYDVDEKGVHFSFEAPKTIDGDKALSMVRRGDVSGCSFAFCTHYWDNDFVERRCNIVNGRSIITYRVKAVTDIRDFTLAIDPAYPDTSVSARELEPDAVPTSPGPDDTKMREQVRQMRLAAKKSI